jgi:xylan 1,4-beta-xylosidase
MITNPILPGFNPDPSALRVGDDYYIATSTFEWWPGVEIYHSRDLVNWDCIAEPLDRISLLDLGGVYNSGGIWAPHLSYSEGKFWLCYTNVKSATRFKDTLNFITTAVDIRGSWSDPVFVNASGFDPSLFHDADGRHYFLNMLYDWQPDCEQRFAGTVIQEFDTKTMRLNGKRQKFDWGTTLGVSEGPQILQKDGYYYLLCAAGGTGYNHAAVVKRSRALQGPYEQSPFFPLLSSRDTPDLPVQKAGHACFLCIGDDEWYITHLGSRPLARRGNCPLGRETFLQKIIWEDGWPRLANGTNLPDVEMVKPSMAKTVIQQRDRSERIDFDSPQLPRSMKSLRLPLGELASLTARPGWLRLHGAESLSSLHRQSLIARRWQSFHFSVQVKVEFIPASFQQMAGLILFYDSENWMYLFIGLDNDEKRVLRIETAEHNQFAFVGEAVPLPAAGALWLSAEVNREALRFAYSLDGKQYIPIGGVLPADHLSDDHVEKSGRLAFSGAMAGMCCQDMDDHSAYADFDYFEYKEC